MTPLEAARAARLPVAGLAALAPLRGAAGVSVVEAGASAWVTWEPKQTPAVSSALLPVAGATFYRPDGDAWVPVGRHLPDFDVPLAGPTRAVEAAVLPASADVTPTPPRVSRRRAVAGDARRPGTPDECLAVFAGGTGGVG